MSFLNEEDEALVPNPGYPTYSSAVKLAGGKVIEYNLLKKNNWFPDFEELERKVNSGKVKLMFVNYPQMPTGQLPTLELFKSLVSFGKKHGILIIHDNPYSFILNDKPLSLLQADEEKETVIELNSLSKSHNMAGWRVGMLVGSKERIEQVLRFKSNMDSGMFLPVQLAAAKALSLGKQWNDELNRIYRERQQKLFQLLDLLDCKYDRHQAGLFVWAEVPNEYRSGYGLSDEVLYGSNVFITPGGIFGSAGEGFVRVSLCATVEKIEEAIARVKNKLSDARKKMENHLDEISKKK
jgi:aspartate/methionine/tyrosine aminotransferase